MSSTGPSFFFVSYSKYPYTIDTVKRIPVPDPIAPRKSAAIVITPIHIPPKMAAIGIYFSKILMFPLSL